VLVGAPQLWVVGWGGVGWGGVGDGGGVGTGCGVERSVSGKRKPDKTEPQRNTAQHTQHTIARRAVRCSGAVHTVQYSTVQYSAVQYSTVQSAAYLVARRDVVAVWLH
jgi:hypothetical protein